MTSGIWGKPIGNSVLNKKLSISETQSHVMAQNVLEIQKNFNDDSNSLIDST